MATEPVRLWTLHKDGRTTTCDAVAHPPGLEVVATVAGEIMRTEVARTPAAAQVLSDQWQRAFRGKGWSA